MVTISRPASACREAGKTGRRKEYNLAQERRLTQGKSVFPEKNAMFAGDED
jgi:hypothetical protein